MSKEPGPDAPPQPPSPDAPSDGAAPDAPPVSDAPPEPPQPDAPPEADEPPTRVKLESDGRSGESERSAPVAGVQQGKTNKGLYGALIATVGVAAFFAGLSVPVLNDDPISMSDLEQAVLFLESKIDTLSADLQEFEDTVLVEPQDASSVTEPSPAVSPDDDPVLGSVDAPITMIEFSDFECPFCARFYSETLPLIKENYIDTGKVKMVYRDFPLENIHPAAVPAALASECADDQGAYWRYHDELFDTVGEWGGLSPGESVELFKTYATDMGLDAEEFADCLDSNKYLEEVSGDFNDGRAYGVTGTPAFFLGNEQIGYYPLAGARPYAEFQFAFEQLLGMTSQ